MLFDQIEVEQDHLESVLLAHLRPLEPSAVEVGTELAHLYDLGRYAADAAGREGDP